MPPKKYGSQDTAATAIQARYRGNKARKQTNRVGYHAPQKRAQQHGLDAEMRDTLAPLPSAQPPNKQSPGLTARDRTYSNFVGQNAASPNGGALNRQSTRNLPVVTEHWSRLKVWETKFSAFQSRFVSHVLAAQPSSGPPPVTPPVTPRGDSQSAFRLRIARVDQPPKIPGASGELVANPGSTLAVRLSASLFDAGVKRFFGRTLRGDLVPVPPEHLLGGMATTGGSVPLTFPMSDMFWVTSLGPSTQVEVVVEVVVCVVQGDMVLSERGIGWCRIPARRTAGGVPMSLPLLAGTPRTLLFMSNMATRPVPQGSNVVCTVDDAPGFLATKSLVPEDCLLNYLSVIPGLSRYERLAPPTAPNGEPTPQGAPVSRVSGRTMTPLGVPVPMRRTGLVLHHLFILLPHGFCQIVRSLFPHLPAGPAAQPGTTEFMLQVSAHNGLTRISPMLVCHNVRLDVVDSTGMGDPMYFKEELTVQDLGEVKLPDFMMDESVVLTFELVYTGVRQVPQTPVELVPSSLFKHRSPRHSAMSQAHHVAWAVALPTKKSPQGTVELHSGGKFQVPLRSGPGIWPGSPGPLVDWRSLLKQTFPKMDVKQLQPHAYFQLREDEGYVDQPLHVPVPQPAPVPQAVAGKTGEYGLAADLARRNAAATKLQANYRGHRVRLQHPEIHHHQMPKPKPVPAVVPKPMPAAGAGSYGIGAEVSAASVPAPVPARAVPVPAPIPSTSPAFDPRASQELLRQHAEQTRELLATSLKETQAALRGSREMDDAIRVEYRALSKQLGDHLTQLTSAIQGLRDSTESQRDAVVSAAASAYKTLSNAGSGGENREKERERLALALDSLPEAVGSHATAQHATVGGPAGALVHLDDSSVSTSAPSRATLAALHANEAAHGDVNTSETLGARLSSTLREGPPTTRAVAIDPRVERVDKYTVNEVVVHFVALRKRNPTPESNNTPAAWADTTTSELAGGNAGTTSTEQNIPRKLRFRFQFFDCPPTDIGPVPLDPADKSSGPKDDTHSLFVLRGSPAGDDAGGAYPRAGVAIKYRVGPGYDDVDDRGLRRNRLVEYCTQKAMRVEVYDAETYLLVGSAEVNLRGVLRQGRGYCEDLQEVPLISPSDGLSSGMEAAATQLRRNVQRDALGYAAPVTLSSGDAIIVRLVNVGRVCDAMRSETEPIMIDPVGGGTFPKSALKTASSSFAASSRNRLKKAPGRRLRVRPSIMEGGIVAEELKRNLADGGAPIGNGTSNLRDALLDKERLKLRRRTVLKRLLGARDVNTIVQPETGGALDKEVHQALYDDVDTARSKYRREIVSTQLREVLRLTRVIRPCYGEAVLIEHLFVNPGDAPGNYIVQCEGKGAELRVVTSASEWLAMRKASERRGGASDGVVTTHDHAAPSDGSASAAAAAQDAAATAPVQDGVVDASGRLHFTGRGDATVVPFRFQSYAGSPFDNGGRRVLRICLVNEATGAVATVVEVDVRPRPMPVDHTLRLAGAERDYLKRRVPLPRELLDLASEARHGAAGGADDVIDAASPVHCVVSDAQSVQVSVSASSVPSGDRFGGARYVPTSAEVRLQVKLGPCSTPDAWGAVALTELLASERSASAAAAARGGSGASTPAVLTFFLLLYADRERCHLVSTWRVEATAYQVLDCSTTVGQTWHVLTALRGAADRARQVALHTSAPDEVRPRVPRFTLDRAATHQLEFAVRPAAAGPLRCAVHVVDEEDGALVGAMLLRSDAHPPAISRTFETNVRLGGTKKARFTYTNPFATSRAYRVRSTHPWLVSFVPSELQLCPGRSANVGIVVDAKRRSAAWLVRNEAVDVLIFINDDDDKCVEAVRLRVHVD